MTTSNISQPAKESKPEIHLSKAGWSFYDLLSGIRNLYRRENKLHPNGSFFKTNSFFEKRVAISRRWFNYLKKELQEKGLIRYTVGGGRGNATYYWILDAPPESETPNRADPATPVALDCEAIRQEAEIRGKKNTIRTWVRLGHIKADIEACFEG